MHEVANNTKTRPQLPSPRDCPEWFTRMPLARWGWRELNLYGWPLLAATVSVPFLGWPWGSLALVPGSMLFLLLYFFRDPRRAIPGDPSAIVSPADGRVVVITDEGCRNLTKAPKLPSQ